MNINPQSFKLPQLRLCDKEMQISTSIKLLGVLFSNDLKTNSHFLNVLNKCYYGMAAITKLHQSGLRGITLWCAYLAFVFSQISYCWPAVCDISKRNLQKCASFEKRASKLSNCQIDNFALINRLNKICTTLMKKIQHNKDHPIRKCFQERTNLPESLRKAPLLILNHKSVKLYDYTHQCLYCI